MIKCIGEVMVFVICFGAFYYMIQSIWELVEEALRKKVE